ncbi:MAG: MATE family efflux transporter [Lachnospiraceae bacterium]|nr:MATE family efflux transporter [Lachnospiraceae bacterium]
MTKDLTVGNPSKVLWQFCMPLLGSVLFQQMYNLADSLIAGKLIGENALAAVGNSYEITLIFLAFAFGCNMGSSVTVSKFFGAGKFRSMKTAITTACLFTGAICVVLMAVGLLGSDALLSVINTPAELFADSRLYLDIYVWGLPFLFFYNIATGIFSALGDSKTPFYFLAVSSLANIAVDIWFIKSFHMGVAGVAWATFICQGLSCIAAMVVVFRRLRLIEPTVKAPLFDGGILKQIMSIAIPSTLQQSFISLGNIVIQTLINGFGAPVVAGYAASVKLNNMVITSFNTIGNGISNYTAQNMGAGKLERIPAGMKAGVKMVWMLTVPVTLLYVFGGRVILNLFIDQPTPLAMNTGIIFLRILSPFYIICSVKMIADGILRGAGLMKQFMAATFTDLLLRVVMAMIFSVTVLGATGIWCAWPIGWCTGTVMSIVYYRKGPWRKHLKKGEAKPADTSSE